MAEGQSSTTKDGILKGQSIGLQEHGDFFHIISTPATVSFVLSSSGKITCRIKTAQVNIIIQIHKQPCFDFLTVVFYSLPFGIGKHL